MWIALIVVAVMTVGVRWSLIRGIWLVDERLIVGTAWSRSAY